MEQFKFIKDLFEEELQSINRLIHQNLNETDIPLISEIGTHITKSGGKRVRPLLVLLSAKINEYTGTDHIKLATSIEFIHTATLLHDDVIDESTMRRDSRTANSIWSDKRAILVGDYLYSKAFQILAEVNNIEIIKVITEASTTIAEGEILQLLNIENEHLNVEQYLEVIDRKTAKLFSASTTIGTLLTNKNVELMSEYGKNLGLAFQIIDDILDYSENNSIGKDIGNDLAEGKLTLPLMYGLQDSSKEEQKILKSALKNKDNFKEVLQILKANDSLEKSKKMAFNILEKTKEDIKKLPNTRYLEAANLLLDFCIERTF